MEFADLKAQYARLKQPIRERIDAVLEHGRFIMGPEIAELESKLAAYARTRHCVTCASGTDALLMPLMAWNIGPGDAVFVPVFTFFATAETAALLGATPIFVDIKPDTFNIDAAKLEKAVEAVIKQDPSIHPLPKQALTARLKPKAVIPVDLFGQAADYQKITAVADKRQLLVLEDAAQAFGGAHHGRKICGLGCRAAATSFFPAKPLGCYGDGGAIFTDDDELADILQSIRVHGKGSHKYDNARIGLNGRLDTLQAAILLPKLDILDDEIAARNSVARRYNDNLKNVKLTTPTIADGNYSAWAQYSVLSDRRDRLTAALKDKGIPTNIYYPKPLHAQSAMAYLGYEDAAFPIANAVSQRIFSLPMHPYLSETDIDSITAALAENA